MDKDLRALIADDSQDDAQLIVFELEGRGFRVIWERVQNADELRRALATQKWDIVLSDYSMPHFNAVDVLTILKEAAPDLPSIVISGTIGEQTAVEVMQAGAHDYFVKGNLGRLGAAVRRELVEAENLREKRKFEADWKASEAQRWLDQEQALKVETESRKKVETLLYEAQKAGRLKEEFLTVLSHELRTPMNAITGWAELLFKNECDPEEYPAAFATIYRNAQAQNKLIDDLLDLSRIVAGKLVIESESVQLADIVSAAIETFQLEAKAKQISINLALRSGRSSVIGDQRRLLEVICNLLSNSIKFTPLGGHIDLRLQEIGPMIEFTISDTGRGVDAEFLPFIFDRFRQADGSLNRQHGGLGLGLSIVRYLVELHGGQIQAQSPGPGKGLTVVVKFPAAAVDYSVISKDPSRQVSYAVGKELTGLRFLIVDDQIDSLNLVNFILKKHGAVVTAVLSPIEALRIFKLERPDVFLSDIEMPISNGYELMQQIREFENGRQCVPAGALTAHARPTDIDRAIAAGFNSHVAKPIDSARLIGAVMSLAGRSAPRELHA